MTEDDCGLVGSVGADLNDAPNYTDRERVMLLRQYVRELHTQLMCVYDDSCLVNDCLIEGKRRKAQLVSRRLVMLTDGITDETFEMFRTPLQEDRSWDSWLEGVAMDFFAPPTKPTNPQTEDDEGAQQ